MKPDFPPLSAQLLGLSCPLGPPQEQGREPRREAAAHCYFLLTPRVLPSPPARKSGPRLVLPFAGGLTAGAGLLLPAPVLVINKNSSDETHPVCQVPGNWVTLPVCHLIHCPLAVLEVEVEGAQPERSRGWRSRPQDAAARA